MLRLAAQGTLAVLLPAGPIGAQERQLIAVATGLMLLVVIPVFVLTGYIAWTYRAENTRATYTPDWDHHALLEFIWWAIPCAIIGILAVLTWQSSHRLDPSRHLTSSSAPLTVEVVALRWKWLFIYPELGVATINYLPLPTQRPVTFYITSDAPMNSFWIPQLGGQIYAMPGMSTQLNLQADQPGAYRGLSANLSGEGFAGMTFTAQASPEGDFERWVATARRSGNHLDQAAYDQLAAPSQNVPPATYAQPDSGLFYNAVMKYMLPTPLSH